MTKERARRTENLNNEVYLRRSALHLEPLAATMYAALRSTSNHWNVQTVLGYGIALLYDGQVPPKEAFPQDRSKLVAPKKIPLWVSYRLTEVQSERLRVIAERLKDTGRFTGHLRGLTSKALRLAVVAVWLAEGRPRYR